MEKQISEIPKLLKGHKFKEFLTVWKKNFVLAECIYVSIEDGKVEEALAYFRPAGGFTHFYVRKPLNEIFTEMKGEESIFIDQSC